MVVGTSARHIATLISNAHFDRLMQHIEAALQELALDPADISTVLETISGTRSDIVTS